MPRDFNVVVVNKDGNTAFVAVSGRIGVLQAQEFRSHCKALLDAGHLHLIIDMVGVDFVASKGAGALITLSEAFHAKGGTVQVIHASDPVKRMIELLNASRFITIVESEEEAMTNIQAQKS